MRIVSSTTAELLRSVSSRCEQLLVWRSVKLRMRHVRQRGGGLINLQDSPWRWFVSRETKRLDGTFEEEEEDFGPGRSERMRRLEAVLFLAREPLPARKLSQYANLADGTQARTLIKRLNKLYDEGGRSFRVEHVAGGYQMFTRSGFAPWLRRLEHAPALVRLSAPAMETLAVIAYRQPVLRADIEAIRGVNCGEILRQLMDRDLVRIGGRSEELGRPYLYTTTKRFLQTFGLASLDELPRAEWFRQSASEPALQETHEQASETQEQTQDLPNPSLSPPFEDPSMQQEEDSDVSKTTTTAIAELQTDPQTENHPQPNHPQSAGAGQRVSHPIIEMIDEEDDDDFDDYDDEEEDDVYDDEYDEEEFEDDGFDDEDLDDEDFDEEEYDEWEEVDDDYDDDYDEDEEELDED